MGWRPMTAHFRSTNLHCSLWATSTGRPSPRSRVMDRMGTPRARSRSAGGVSWAISPARASTSSVQSPERPHDTAAETEGVPAVFPGPQLQVAHAGGEDVPLVGAAVRVVDDPQAQLVPVHLLPPGHVRALHGHVIETLEEAAGGEVGDPLLLPPSLLVVQPRVHDLGDLDGVAVRIDELQQAPLHVGVVHRLDDGAVLRGPEPVGREEALEVGEGMSSCPRRRRTSARPSPRPAPSSRPRATPTWGRPRPRAEPGRNRRPGGWLRGGRSQRRRRPPIRPSRLSRRQCSEAR